MSASPLAKLQPADDAPVLNPGRFANLDVNALYSLAREWMRYETAFGMCLNVAVLSGKKELASMLAAHMGSAKLGPALFLYRSAGLMEQAMEVAGSVSSLIRPGAPVSGIVLDAIAAAKTVRPELHKSLLRKIIAAAPDLKWSTSSHAYLYREAREALGKTEAQALGRDAEPTAKPDADIRIAGLTRVRNEGALVSECVGNMLEFCDFVLVFDHNSDDGAPEEARARFGDNRVEILRQSNMELFDEKRVNEHLFARSREKKATHMVLVDADERASPRLADPESLRAYARSQTPGEVLTVPYRQVWGDGFVDYSRFAGLNDGVRFLPPYRDFLYCDDGRALHRSMMLHTPWLPNAYPAQRHFIDDPAFCNIHFEKANYYNGMVKNDLYILRELFHFNTPLPTVLSRYLGPHLIHNATLDDPPLPDALAIAPCEDYKTLCAWRLRDARALTPKLPPAARFLLNFLEA